MKVQLYHHVVVFNTRKSGTFSGFDKKPEQLSCVRAVGWPAGTLLGIVVKIYIHIYSRHISQSAWMKLFR